MPSYEDINYSLRPAKHIERKMMLEIFRSLSVFAPISSYRYIGFGSIYFSDFYLIHKQLGITDMTSIEKDKDNEKRFIFNRPFKCINMEFGSSVDILPDMTWGNQKTIVWLDYDGPLNKEVIGDIKCLCNNLGMGSMIIISVNADPERENNASRGVELLKKRVGEDNVPDDITDSDLRKWGTAAAIRRIIDNQIQAAVSVKNGIRSEGNKVMYQQLFNFNYSDGSKMVTVGGILFDESQKNLLPIEYLQATHHFIRTEEKPYTIKVPNLTYREIRYLDKMLPADLSSIESEINIPLEDLIHYSETYRYFPNFSETEN